MRNIEHTTEIHAPIDKVWSELIKINEWEQWNKWTILEADSTKTGTPGKLKASFEGDGKWDTYDFIFGQVDEEKHLLEWQGFVGGGVLFSGRHHMKLESGASPGVTKLEHKEVFGGLLPMLGIGLPYKKLDRNYLYINEAFKKHVEEMD
jgi:hypothetical protein